MTGMNSGPGKGDGSSDDCCEIERLSQLMDGEWQGVDLSRSVKGVCVDEALRAKWTRFHLARDAMRQEPIETDNALAARISAAIADEQAYSNVTSLGGNFASSDDISGERLANEHVDVVADRAEIATVVSSGGQVRTWATGFGLAASVALVTVLGLDAWQSRGGPATDSSQLAQADSAVEVSGVGATATLVAEVSDDTRAEIVKVQSAPLPQVQLVANTGAYWVAPGSAERRIGGEERLNMMLSEHIESSPTAERHGMLPYSRLVGYDEANVAR